MAFEDYRLGERIHEKAGESLFRGVRIEDSYDVSVRVVRIDEADGEQASRLVDAYEKLSTISHQHLIKIVEVGRYGNDVFCVSEWCVEGNLVDRLESGLSIRDFTRYVKDIAAALDALHSHGIVHGDVKPSNLLFSDRDVIVLNDASVSLNRGSSSYVSDRGTQGYLSPERLRHEDVGGASDFYSLGVLMYRVLTGELPTPTNQGFVAWGTRDERMLLEKDARYRAFVPALKALLATDAGTRCHSAERLNELLSSVQVGGMAPRRTSPVDSVRTADIEAVLPPVTDTGSLMTLGNRPPNEWYRTKAGKAVSVVLLLVALIGTLTAITFDEQDKVQLKSWLAYLGFGEHPELVQAQLSAEALRADPNQGLEAVIAAYRRVLAFDPENLDATDGMTSVKSDWETRARTALDRNELSVAQATINELLQAYPSDPVAANLFEQLQNRRVALRILDNTRALVAATGIRNDVSAGIALDGYREVARLYPESDEAIEQLDIVAEHFSNRAIEAANKGEVSIAMQHLGRAVTANPEFERLEDVRSVISRAETLQAEIASMVQEAGQLRQSGNLIMPPGANAAELSHQVLSTDPENSIAAQGLSEINSQVQARFNELLVSRNFSAINDLLTRSSLVNLDVNAISSMRHRLDDELTRISQAAELIAEARSQIVNGYITVPVGNNAVSLLRQAGSLDPSNETIGMLLQQCADRLMQVAIDANRFDMEATAQEYIELALTVMPESGEIRRLRDEWAPTSN